MITHDVLTDLLTYDSETGVFYWNKTRCGRALKGSKAGTLRPDGYIQIGVSGYQYAAHRLAWFYIYREWPTELIDHKDHVRHNNRINNLRVVDSNGNNQNRVTPSKNNNSGYLGVSYSKTMRQWHAKIGLKYKTIHLGFYSSPEEAYSAYLKAKSLVHPDGHCG